MKIKNRKSEMTLVVMFLSLATLITPVQAQLNREAIQFKKTIEPAMIAYGLHNAGGKTEIQNIFFPNQNAILEFYVDPSSEGLYGFKIDSIGEFDHFLVVKWVCNWEEIQKKMGANYPVKPTTREALIDKSEEERREILQYNRQQYSKRYSKAISEYNVKTKNILISRSLSEQLYKSQIFLIENHVNKGIPNISKGGSVVTYRCVVGDEVWNFSTKNPIGLFKELTTICSKIVKDVRDNEKIEDEEKYIQQLEQLTKNK